MYVCMWREKFLMSALSEGEFSKLSPKKIKVGKVSIFGSDIIGHCGIKRFI